MAQPPEDGQQPRAGGGAQDDEAILNWIKNAPMLYDLFLGITLEWPALSVAWLAGEGEEGCRLAFGTHTAGTANSVVIAELDCTADDELGANPWKSLDLPGIGRGEGFGCTACTADGPLRVVATLPHPTEVNRIAPCPHRSQLLATKAATGAVLLFDWKAELAAERVGPDAWLIAPGTPVDGADGFPVCWSHVEQRHLATGGNDGRLCIWDVEVAPRVGGVALHTFAAHTGGLGDLAFSRTSPSLLASVGDDAKLQLWDARAGHPPQVCAIVGQDEVLAVDWSKDWDRTLVTAGKDKEVRVWDTRKLHAPTKRLQGHKADVVRVSWAPFREGLLASCSSDSQVRIWDLQQEVQESEMADGEAPELLFAHGGHSRGVSDFAWSAVDDFLLASVDEDNDLHLWQPSTVFYLDDDGAGAGGGAGAGAGSEGGGGEPSAKRPCTRAPEK